MEIDRPWASNSTTPRRVEFSEGDFRQARGSDCCHARHTKHCLSTRGTKFWSENGADPGASGAIRNFDETSLLMLEAGEDDSPSVQMQSGPSPSKMLQSHPSGDVRTTSSPGDARLRRSVSNKIRAVVAEKVLSKVSNAGFAVDVLHSDPSAAIAVLQWLRTGDRSGHVSSRGPHLCVSWWKENVLIVVKIVDGINISDVSRNIWTASACAHSLMSAVPRQRTCRKTTSVHPLHNRAKQRS